MLIMTNRIRFLARKKSFLYSFHVSVEVSSYFDTIWFVKKIELLPNFDRIFLLILLFFRRINFK